MLTVHKLKLATVGMNVVQLPKHAAILCAHEQDGIPTIWYKCDTEQPLVEHKLYVAGTGHELPPSLLHIGTCFCGPLVWHVFEVYNLDDLFQLEDEGELH